MDTPFTMGISLMCVWCADASGGRVHGNGMGRCDKRARGGHPHPPTDTLPFPNFNSARPPTTCPSRSASWTRRRWRRPRWPRPRREEGDSERVEVSRVCSVCSHLSVCIRFAVHLCPLCRHHHGRSLHEQLKREEIIRKRKEGERAGRPKMEKKRRRKKTIYSRGSVCLPVLSSQVCLPVRVLHLKPAAMDGGRPPPPSATPLAAPPAVTVTVASAAGGTLPGAAAGAAAAG